MKAIFRSRPNLLLLATVIFLLVFTATIDQRPLAASDSQNDGPFRDILLMKENPRLDSFLNRLVLLEKLKPAVTRSSPTPMPSATEKVRVIITALPGKIEAVERNAGLMGAPEAKYGNEIQMVVPVSALTRLAQLPDISRISVPVPPFPTVISEGRDVINADDWQGAGYDGTGVKIGIIDVGFAGYTDRQAEGELPANLSTWWGPSLGGPGTVSHGTACAEIIYDVAPGADYYLASIGTRVELGDAVDWMIGQGVNIISCSIVWPTGGPGDGTGPICEIIDNARTAGILWVQSAGNYAQRHWQGSFHDPDISFPHFHNFSGTDEGNDIQVNFGQTIAAALKWDDPWGASSNDYDLFLYDRNDNLAMVSVNIQNGDDEPWEYLEYTATYSGTYSLRIVSLHDNPPPQVVDFHLYTPYQNLEYQTASSSFFVPADSPNALTAGAVPYSSPDTIESFSSRGPTDDGRIKPDLVAPDGVSTMSYGTDGFYGTSASAPHVAGAAALVKQFYPAFTPAQVHGLLESWATDLGNPGKDNTYGSGRLHLSDLANLTMAISGSGTTDPPPGTYTYPLGTVVSISATPAPNWTFNGWAGDVADPASANTTVTINAEKTVTANFIQASANLTMAISGSGTTDPPPGTYTYPLGTVVSISATPAPNWTFNGWSGDVADPASANTTVTINAEKTVTANFISTGSTGGSTGGGGGIGGPPPGMAILSDKVRLDGQLVTEVRAIAAETKMFLTLSPGTICHDQNGGLLSWVFIKTLAPNEPVPEINQGFIRIASVYDLHPPGATFDPPVMMTFFYDPALIPEGMSAGNLVIITWDAASEQWLPLDGFLDETKKSITTPLSHFSLYTLAVRPLPAEISLTDVRLIPGSIFEEETASLTISLVNTGDLEGSYEAELKIGDSVAGRQKISVPAQGKTEVNFTVSGLAAGTHTLEIEGRKITLTVLPKEEPKPASFSLGPLTISANEVATGEEVTIYITVTNTGEIEGSDELTLRVNGQDVSRRSISLPGGASEEVSFHLSFETPGKKIISINDSMGSLIVRGESRPPEPVPVPAAVEEPPAQAPDPSPDGELTAISTPADLSTPAPAEAEPETTGQDRSWIIILCLAAFFTASAFFWKVRKRTQNSR